MAEYQPLSATLGNLVGVCPVCEAKMFRRISLAKINDVRGTLAIAFARELRHSTG
jgi:hypothetical protein